MINQNILLMNKILYTLLAVLACTSCTKSFNIQGSSNISMLDGRMLYLKAIKGGELKNIDSCEVVHGQFKFSGSTDSSHIATIFMDDESVMPIVIEEGDITIKLNRTKQECTGTELNDKLFAFLEKYNSLRSRYAELSHRENQAIMDGQDMDSTYRKLTEEAEKIVIEEDKLITGFICENFDNVLGPGVFMMVTSTYEFPELTPWIEDIMSKATETFKNDEYVREYITAAERNQNIRNGMEDSDVAPVATPQMSQTEKASIPGDDGSGVPPTPAEMAQPKK